MSSTSFEPEQLRYIYDLARKVFVLISCTVFPLTFFVNAPFGRFTPNSTFLTFDGRKAWIAMELWSPALFLYTFLTSPLSSEKAKLTSPQLILAATYIIHYANRAVISPLRTPSRSRSHLLVPLMCTFLNILNGSLMGSYLASPAAHAYLQPSRAFNSPTFYIGLVIWTLGFIGNIVHDEILSDIRRKANSKGKNESLEPSNGVAKREHYAIPHGLLYRYVSFPNYLCEWIEWFGCALAATPVPITSLSQLSPQRFAWLLSAKSIGEFLAAPPSKFAPMLTPPYIFLLVEILFMFPRAYAGHQWYKQKFGAAFPKERKIVIPFVL